MTNTHHPIKAPPIIFIIIMLNKKNENLDKPLLRIIYRQEWRKERVGAKREGLMHQSQISLLKNKEELATSSRLLAIGDWLFILNFLGENGKIYCKEKNIGDWIYDYYILMRIYLILKLKHLKKNWRYKTPPSFFSIATFPFLLC